MTNKTSRQNLSKETENLTSITSQLDLTSTEYLIQMINLVFNGMLTLQNILPQSSMTYIILNCTDIYQDWPYSDL